MLHPKLQHLSLLLVLLSLLNIHTITAENTYVFDHEIIALEFLNTLENVEINELYIKENSTYEGLGKVWQDESQQWFYEPAATMVGIEVLVYTYINDADERVTTEHPFYVFPNFCHNGEIEMVCFAFCTYDFPIIMNIAFAITGGTPPYQVEKIFNGILLEKEVIITGFENYDYTTSEAFFDLSVKDQNGNIAEYSNKSEIACITKPDCGRRFKLKHKLCANQDSTYTFYYWTSGGGNKTYQGIPNGSILAIGDSYSVIVSGISSDSDISSEPYMCEDIIDNQITTTSYYSNTRSNSISIFPNPVQTNLYISTSFSPSIAQNEIIDVQIYNLEGQKVMEQSMVHTETHHRFDLQNLANGTYFVRVMVGDHSITEKIIVDN